MWFRSALFAPVALGAHFVSVGDNDDDNARAHQHACVYVYDELRPAELVNYTALGN